MKKKFFLILFLIFLLATACSSESSLFSDSGYAGLTASALVTQTTTVHDEPTASPTASPSKTLIPTATLTPLPPTIKPTPWALTTFTSSLLYPGVSPVSYIEDTCAYLENRWGEDKSKPGTIVVPIMFHSILKPERKIDEGNNEPIYRADFEFFVQRASDMGFETITAAQLLGFLEHNESIPPRSMMIILDDRRPGTVEYMMPFLEENDWTVTLAWITIDSTSEASWSTLERLSETGRLDIQSHGHNSIPLMSYTPLSVIENELNQSKAVLESRFAIIPIAYIWPGGNFTAQTVEMAREADYQLGFTVFSRGPLMFNWIPLGEAEQAVEDPLMVLPRYWSVETSRALEEAVAIAEAAQAAAEKVKEEELLYYALFCQSGEGD